jgi:glycosyltransferase involved in cell wall biosynthesis
MPDPMDLWSGVAYRTVCNDSWHLVVSTAGPYSVHAPAYRLRRAGLTKHWIADWRDLWTDNHLFPGLPLFRNIECWLEQRWCRLADHITTVSEPLADTMRSKYGDKVAVIYNGFDPEDYANLPNEKAFPDDDVFRLVYTGTFYKGKLDPTPVFAAVKKMTLDGKLTPAKLQILFCGQDTDVSDLAASHEVSGYVQCLGLVPRAKALHMQRDANALLFLGFETEKVKGILTGKLFEYLIAGPQILAVGINSDSSVGKLLRQTGNDFICGQDLDLVILNISLLMNMMKSSKSLAQNNEKYSLIGSFSRSMQADAMLSLAIIR